MSASITYLDSAKLIAQKKGNSMNNVLLMDTTGLEGVYVVSDGMNSREVKVSARTPSEAYKLAVARGVSDPVLVYVPTESEKTSVFWQN
jgi:hypothetical protein